MHHELSPTGLGSVKYKEIIGPQGADDRRFQMEILASIALIVAAGMAFLAFILPAKMIGDIRREDAGKCYDDCMRKFRWETNEAPACITDCRLQ